LGEGANLRGMTKPRLTNKRHIDWRLKLNLIGAKRKQLVGCPVTLMRGGKGGAKKTENAKKPQILKEGSVFLAFKNKAGQGKKGESLNT